MFDEQPEALATDAPGDETDPEAPDAAGDDGDTTAAADDPVGAEAPAEAEAAAEPDAEASEATAEGEPVEAEASAEPVEAEAPAEPEAEAPDPGQDDGEETATVDPEVQEYIGQDTTVVHEGGLGGVSSPFRTPPGIPSGLDPGKPDERG